MAFQDHFLLLIMLEKLSNLGGMELEGHPTPPLLVLLLEESNSPTSPPPTPPKSKTAFKEDRGKPCSFTLIVMDWFSRLNSEGKCVWDGAEGERKRSKVHVCVCVRVGGGVINSWPLFPKKTLPLGVSMFFIRGLNTQPPPLPGHLAGLPQLTSTCHMSPSYHFRDE